MGCLQSKIHDKSYLPITTKQRITATNYSLNKTNYKYSIKSFNYRPLTHNAFRYDKPSTHNTKYEDKKIVSNLAKKPFTREAQAQIPGVKQNKKLLTNHPNLPATKEISRLTKDVKIPYINDSRKTTLRTIQMPYTKETRIPVVKDLRKPTSKTIQMPYKKEARLTVVKEVRKPTLRDLQMPCTKETRIPVLKDARKATLRQVQMPFIKESRIPVLKELRKPTLREIQMPLIKEARKPVGRDLQGFYKNETRMPIVKEIKTQVINQAIKPAIKEVKKQVQSLSEVKKRYTFSYEHSTFIEEALYAHNICRQRHGVPLLTHNPALSKIAQDYANYLAQSRKLVHSHSTYKGECLGENLSYWYNNKIQKFSGIRATLQWYEEIKDHCFSLEYQSNTGHFTQIIWKDTTEVGFGIAQDARGGFYAVALYNPSGNYKGEFYKNVFRPMKSRKPFALTYKN